MGYPNELVFHKAPPPEPATRITLLAKDVILNALLGHLLGNLSYKRMLVDVISGKKDALGISLPDDLCLQYAAKAVDRIPVDFDDPQAVHTMMIAYDTLCDRGDTYSQNEFERTLQRLLQDLNQ